MTFKLKLSSFTVMSNLEQSFLLLSRIWFDVISHMCSDWLNVSFYNQGRIFRILIFVLKILATTCESNF